MFKEIVESMERLESLAFTRRLEQFKPDANGTVKWPARQPSKEKE